MKVLLVHNYYRSHQTGGEDIVFRAEKKALISKLGAENVFEFSKSNDDARLYSVLFNALFSISSFINIVFLVIRKRIDIVHFHNTWPLVSPSAIVAARVSGAATVVTMHNYRSWCIAGTFFLNQSGICEHCATRAFSLRPLKRRCFRNSWLQSAFAALILGAHKKMKTSCWANRVFVLTEFQRKKVISLGVPEEKIVLKPNFVSPPGNGARTERQNSYLFVGRFEESKGVEVLLNAWSTMPPGVTLTLIGTGPLEEELKSRFQAPNIVFLGQLPREKVWDEMKRALFLVQPSVWYETFGLTIIEAMSVGTPVVGFRLGTRSDFIVDGENGFLAEEGDLAATLLRSMRSLEYASLSACAEKSASSYSEDKIISAQVSVYQSLL